MSKRYSSDLQLCHAFAHRLTEAGHCAGNTSFSNDVFYSYSTPIAARVETPVISVILLSTDTFSNTTTKHKSKLVSAINNVYEVVPARYIPTDLRNAKAVSDIHKLNVDFFTDILHKALDAFVGTTRSRVEKARELVRAFEAVDSYTRVFHFSWDNAQPIYQVLEQARAEIEAHNEKRAVQKAHRSDNAFDSEGRKRYKAMIAKSLRKWRSGETDKLPLNKLLEPIALRVTQDRIETSRGASMPRRDVARIWPNLKAMWQSFTEEPTLNEKVDPTKLLLKSAVSNPEMRFGQFVGVHVSKDFIRIGCHTIPWSEVVDVAKQLGLDVTGVDNATAN